jgi:maltose-binding protein MalE
LTNYTNRTLSTIMACSLVLSVLTVSTVHGVIASTKPPRLDRGVTVYVWDPFPKQKKDPERAALRRAVHSWEKRTGNKVKILGNTGSNASRLCSVGAAGKAPDLIAVRHDELAQLVACKVVRSVPAWAWPPSSRRKYIPAAVQAPLISGRERAMPWAVDTSGLFYNRALVPLKFISSGRLRWPGIIREAKRLTKHAPRMMSGYGSGRFGFL